MKKKLLKLVIPLLVVSSSNAQNISFDNQSYTDGDSLPNPFSIVNNGETFKFTISNQGNSVSTTHVYRTNDFFCSSGNLLNALHVSEDVSPVSTWTIEVVSGNKIDFNSINFINFFATCNAFNYILLIEGFEDSTSKGTQNFTVDNFNNTFVAPAILSNINKIVITETGVNNLINMGIDDISWSCTNTSSTITEIACDSYTSPSGNYVWTSSNTYMDTIPNTANCDSIITINLTINSISDLTISTSGTTVSTNNTGATYQWVDCDNNYAVIVGETGQSYIATVNGNYAVELTENGCVDTTACVAITTVGILENNFGNNLLVYPNPTNGNFSIDLGDVYENSEVLITDLSGKLLDSKTIAQSQTLNLSIREPAGIYILSIKAEDKKAVIRLIKE